jgi:hypothetical protein
VYSTSNVVSALIPFLVRNSSIDVRRNWPLMRMSKGMRVSRCSRSLTRVESWCLLRALDIVSDYAPMLNVCRLRAAFVLSVGAHTSYLQVCTNSTVGSSAIWSPGSRVLRRICTLVSAAVESIVCAGVGFG